MSALYRACVYVYQEVFVFVCVYTIMLWKSNGIN